MESTMNYPSNVSLNTPIKKIRNLTLNSPPDRIYHHSENKHKRNKSNYDSISNELYPSIDDIQTSPTVSTMLQKGYSQRLTNNVLSELNLRAQEITQSMSSPSTTTIASTRSQYSQQQQQYQQNLFIGGDTSRNGGNQVMNRRNKRYSGIHFNKFKQMESINQHYSIHNNNNTNTKTPSPQKSNYESTHVRSLSKDTILQQNHHGLEESASKRRRTLNGNDEVIAIPILQNKETTIKESNSSTSISSITGNNNSSPSRKISPSKGSRNLNSMLRQTTDTGSPNKDEFAKPYPPSFKLRQSSLEMAGVVQPSSNSQYFQQQQQQQQQQSRFIKPMVPSLQRKSSIPTLNKKPSLPNLNKKPSLPNLNKKPSIPSLQKKSSIPTLNKKSSIPTLQKKPSMNSLNRPFGGNTPTSPTGPVPMPPPHGDSFDKKQPISQFNNYNSNHNTITNKNTPHLSRVSPSRSLGTSSSTRSINSRVLYNSTNLNTLPKSKSVTIPQPFSLYDKPTISSSQKSLNNFQKNSKINSFNN
ncbi:hypothetical protein K6H09_002344 [Candida tropicalis]